MANNQKVKDQKIKRKAGVELRVALLHSVLRKESSLCGTYSEEKFISNLETKEMAIQPASRA